MLKIRLQRIGKKKQPSYRFVVSDSKRDLYGKQLEILGTYNPFTKVCEVKKDRILYWISVGAQKSPTVHNLLVDQNVISEPKVKASKGKKSAKGGSASGGKDTETSAAEAAAVLASAATPAPTETPATPEVKPAGETPAAQ